jgi:hypothetical protein
MLFVEIKLGFQICRRSAQKVDTVSDVSQDADYQQRKACSLFASFETWTARLINLAAEAGRRHWIWELRKYDYKNCSCRSYLFIEKQFVPSVPLG